MMLSVSRRLAKFTTVSATPKPEIKRTALYDYHVSQGGKLVPFAGWYLPLTYANQTHVESHIHTRTKASLFDVSHMLQTQWSGHERLESLVVGDIQNLIPGQATLSLFTTTTGGILDDTVIQRLETGTKPPKYYVVNNAGCAGKLKMHFRAYPEIEFMDDYSLLAFQGPLSVAILAEISNCPSISALPFMHGTPLVINGIHAHVTRCGYTGEDGVEISVLNTDAHALADILVRHQHVALAGLAARDSLRLEAGLCLYGHDIDESVTPVEAGLTWTIGKERRSGQRSNFLGNECILPQVTNKTQNPPAKRRVGLIVNGAPAREGAHLVHLDSRKVLGEVTSGSPSPMLKKNIAMGYVADGFHKVGSQIGVIVRGKVQVAEVVRMPFVPHNYYRS